MVRNKDFHDYTIFLRDEVIPHVPYGGVLHLPVPKYGYIWLEFFTRTFELVDATPVQMWDAMEDNTSLMFMGRKLLFDPPLDHDDQFGPSVARVP